MVFVMYGIVLLVVFLSVPILATSQTVRLDKERVQNNV
jgi:hypothetical protein